MRRPRSIRSRTLLAVPLLLAGVLSLTPLAVSTGSAALVQAKPSAATGGISNVRGTSAVLNGTVNPGGLATEYFFQFGPTLAYGSETVVKTLPAGFENVKVSAPETGLLLHWHYRIVAVNSMGTTTGKDHEYAVRISKLKVVLAKPKGQFVVGGSLTLSGQLTGAGAANHKVILQSTAYPYTAGFSDASPVVTASAAGRFSFTINNLSTSAEYRVATADPRPIYSSSQTALVSVRVTLHVRSSSHRGVVRLYGTVSPSETGATVFLQVEKPTKHRIFKSEKAEERAEERGPRYANQFQTTVKHATHSFSRFSTIVTITKVGRYRAYVQMRKGPLASGYSSSVTIHQAASGGGKHHRRKK